MFEEAIAIWKEIYGEEHQLVATALNNLASLLKDQVRIEHSQVVEKCFLFESRKGQAW